MSVADLPTAFWVFIAALLGLIFGSFATALIHRVPAGISWHSIFTDQRRSRCPSCDHALSPLNLIPLISWALQRGKCTYCATPIAPVYPLTELFVMLACVSYAAFNGLEGGLGVFVLTLFSFPFLAALLVIDLRSKTLPNILVLCVAVIGLMHLGVVMGTQNKLSPAIIEYGGGAFFYFLAAIVLNFVMSAALKKSALGGGDIKFMAVSGLWLGLSNIGAYFVISGLLGVIIGLAWQKIKREKQFPFGPALILAQILLLCIDI